MNKYNKSLLEYYQELSPVELELHANQTSKTWDTCKGNPKASHTCTLHALSYLVVKALEEFKMNQLLKQANTIINGR